MSKRKRETIVLSEEEIRLLNKEYYFEEEEEDYKKINDLYCIVEDIITEAGYKNSITHEIVLERSTDNKFFKGKYVYYDSADEYSVYGSFEEVFPKQVTTTIYT